MSKLDALWEEAGFPAGEGFWRYLKEENVSGHTKADVLRFVKEQASRQVVRRQRRPKYESSIWASSPRQQYQVDVMVYDRFQRGQYKYVLGVIDVNSRFVQALAITSRQQLDDGSMFKAFKDIMSKMGPPKRLDADNEFASAPIRKWCKDNSVFLNLSFADEAIDNKNAMIESFWKTLARRLAVRRRQGLPDWPKDLSTVISQYNRSFHSTIRAKPIDVWEGRASNKQDIIVVDSRLAVGDLVRRLLKLATFAKGDAQGYSDEVYRITRRDPERRNRWMLEDIDSGEELPRGYTENSLQKISQVVQKPDPSRARTVAVSRRKEEDAPRRNYAAREARRLADDTSFVRPTVTSRSRANARARRAPSRLSPP